MTDTTNKKQRLARIILILCIILFAASAAVLLANMLPRWLTPPVSVPPVDSTPSSAPAEALPANPIDFAALRADNPEIIGWIKIDGTVVDYPILQSGETREENFYINHRPDGSQHKEGSIYIQRINDAAFTDPNTVIYGHNMATGRMFAAIRRYQYKDFFQKNRTVTVYIPGHVLTYEVYSAFVYDNRHILNSFDFSKEEDYNAFLQQTLKPTSMRRQVLEGATVTTDSRIITLCTCTASSKERFLVMGVLINDQKTQ